MDPTTRRIATEEDLRRTPDDGIYELVDGEIRRSLGGGRHAKASMTLAVALSTYVKSLGLGQVFGPNTGHRLPSGNVRCPDVSFIGAARYAGESDSDDFVNVPPDLTVEILSPSDRPRWILDKVGEYLEAGVRLVWVIDPQAKRAAIHRSLTEVRAIGEDGVLDGEGVLPGFHCRLGEVFE